MAAEDTTRMAPKGERPELPEGKRVALSVTQGTMKGKVFPVNRPRVVLGRAGTDIVVDDPDVSRKHCVLEVYGPRAVLVDLDSTNGTFVGGVQAERHDLQHLTEFRIGSTVFLFTITP